MTKDRIESSMAKTLMLDKQIAEAADGCPCRILHIMPEILGVSKPIILNRLRMPSPRRSLVLDGGKEREI